MTLRITRPRSSLVVVDEATAIVELDIGGRGPQGVPGPVGGYLNRIADATLSGHRVVRATSATGVDLCDADELTHLHRAIGITTGAALSGAAVTVLAAGELTESSWSWTPGLPVYCGSLGVLTQSFDPTWAFSRIVGVAETATTIFVQLREPIAL